MSFPGYPSYRDSGFEWLGKVPSHWAVLPLKFVLNGNDGGVWGDDPDGFDDTLVLRSTEQSASGQWRIVDPAFRKLAPVDRLAAKLKAGDLLVTKSSGSALHIGKATLVSKEIEAMSACYSNFMQRLRPSDAILPKLLWYLLSCQATRVQLDLASNSTTGLANLNGTILGQIKTPLPPTAEQAHIVTFLDRETAKIDALVQAQQSLAGLLREKRQTVITHAVTKGLDRTVPMKDSGIEWLGEVPAHWEVERLGTMYREVSEAGSDELPILSVSIHSGVSDEEADPDDSERKVIRSEDRTKYKRVAPNDLTYNMMRAWQGGFGAVQVEGMVSPAYVVARPRIVVPSKYIELLLRTPGAVEQMRRYSRGITDFRLRLYWDQFKEIKVVLPPVDERSAIMDLVEQETIRIESLGSAASAAIDLLNERRAALIFAAITGKINVGAVSEEAEAA